MQKLCRHQLIIILFILILIGFSGCSMGMSDMLNAYNDNFLSGALIKTDNPDNLEFDESMMLLPHYAIRDDSSITLCAPPKCDVYLWELYERDGTGYELEERPAVNPFTPDLSRHTRAIDLRAVGIPENDGQIFSFHVPSTTIPTGTYKLVLTVKKNFGIETKIWTDFCTLVIFTPVTN